MEIKNECCFCVRKIVSDKLPEFLDICDKNLKRKINRMSKIEQRLNGIEKIIEESQKFNGITPQFRWENGLWVEFYFNTDKSLPNGLGDKLGETQQNIIKLMQNNPKIAITALASELGISTTAIEKHIKTLKNKTLSSELAVLKADIGK